MLLKFGQVNVKIYDILNILFGVWMLLYIVRNERLFIKVYVFKFCRVLKMNLLGKIIKKIVQVL